MDLELSASNKMGLRKKLRKKTDTFMFFFLFLWDLLTEEKCRISPELSFQAGLICLVWNSTYVPVSDQHLNICCDSTINIGLHVLIAGFQAPTACILGESTFIFLRLNDDQLLMPLFSHNSFHESTNPGFSLLRRVDVLSKVKLPRRHRGSL